MFEKIIGYSEEFLLKLELFEHYINIGAYYQVNIISKEVSPNIELPFSKKTALELAGQILIQHPDDIEALAVQSILHARSRGNYQ